MDIKIIKKEYSDHKFDNLDETDRSIAWKQQSVKIHTRRNK